jgi:hypothetical protein
MKHHAYMPRPLNICLKKSTTKSLSPRAGAITQCFLKPRNLYTIKSKSKTLNFATNLWIPTEQITKKTPNSRVKRSKPNLKTLQIETQQPR